MRFDDEQLRRPLTGAEGCHLFVSVVAPERSVSATVTGQAFKTRQQLPKVMQMTTG